MKRDLYVFDLWKRIRPEAETIHPRLENWANWSRDKFAQGHCRSIEYRYTPEAGETWDGNEPSVQPQVLDALVIFRIISNPDMPALPRDLLHAWYIKKWSAGKAKKRFAMQVEDLEHELNRARLMVRNRARG